MYVCVCIYYNGRFDLFSPQVAPHKMLSLVASMTPFCDFNQSPRNMYQCVPL